MLADTLRLAETIEEDGGIVPRSEANPLFRAWNGMEFKHKQFKTANHTV